MAVTAGCRVARRPGPVPVALVTAEQARLPDAPPEPVAREFPEDTGPAIVVVSPAEGGVYRAPVNVDIRFEPRDAPVDLSTLAVQYLKFFSIDITDKVRPYASATGVHMHDADLPSGRHSIRVSIADTAGNRASRKMTLTVQ